MVLLPHFSGKCSVFTEMMVIQHRVFCFFFFIRLPDAAASFGVSKDHSNKRQLAAPVCKKQVSRTKPDFEYLSFSAGCDVSSLSGDVIVL